MKNAKELGFLFGYLEKNAAKGLRLAQAFKSLRAPATTKPKPAPAAKAGPPKGAAPQKQVRSIRNEPLRAGPQPEVTAKAMLARGAPPKGAQPVGPATAPSPAPAAGPAPTADVNEDAYGNMAKALGRDVGESAAKPFVPWNERLSPMIGVRPKALDTVGSLASGVIGSHLLGNALKSPQEEALRSYLAANPFMYDQLNPYAASMMA